MPSLTIVVSDGGFPGHATVQLNQGNTTTYMGLGPAKPDTPYATGNYDVVTLPNGTSPIGVFRNPFVTYDPSNPGEFHYIDTAHYNVKSFTFEITDAQANAALAAALSYQASNPNYNVFNGTICADYVLKIMQAAIPGSNTVFFDRVPAVFQQQLVDVVNTGRFYGTAGLLTRRMG